MRSEYVLVIAMLWTGVGWADHANDGIVTVPGPGVEIFNLRSGHFELHDRGEEIPMYLLVTRGYAVCQTRVCTSNPPNATCGGSCGYSYASTPFTGIEPALKWLAKHEVAEDDVVGLFRLDRTVPVIRKEKTVIEEHAEVWWEVK